MKEKLDKEKEILPSTCRIGETIFTSMAVIGGILFINHHKNLNHVHKDSKYFVSVIITLGVNISVGDTLFYDGVKTYDLGNRAHVLIHLHGIMAFGPFGGEIHEGTPWRGHGAVISFILAKKNPYLSIAMEVGFITDISMKQAKKYLDYDGPGVKP